MFVRLLAIFVSIATLGAVHAQTMTTDRISDGTNAVVGFGVSLWDSDETSFNVTGLRFDAHVQYMHELGFGSAGGFVALPVSYAILGLPDEEGVERDLDNEWDMGNLEIGGAYAHRLGAKLRVLGRASIALGTADDEDTDVVRSEGFANLATSYARITDQVLAEPDSTWLRLSASALSSIDVFASPRTTLELRADLGLDVPLADDESVDTDPWARANVAAMLQHPLAGVGFELATVMKTGSVADGVDRFLHTFATVVTTRALGRVVPTIGVVVPADKFIRDELGHEFSFVMALAVHE